MRKLASAEIKRLSHIGVLLALLPLLALTYSCTSDDSTPVTAYAEELVTLHTSAACLSDRAVTDGGETLLFSRPLPARWAQTPDSLYRALLAFSDDEATEGRYWERPTATVTPVRADEVLILHPTPREKATEWSGNHDPIGLDATWLSRDGRYLNIRMSVKSGSTDSGTEKHTIGLVSDTVAVSPTGARHYRYRLCHSQNALPQYYTVTAYLSVPTDSLAAGDTITLTAPTYSGTAESTHIKP